MRDKHVKSTNILLIYDRLRQSPVTLDVLYDWVKKSGIDVSRRTLYRYLDDLAASIVFQGEKLVVFENEFNKKVWKIEFDKSASMLSQFDINSYYMMRGFAPQSITGPREQSILKLDELMYGLASKSRFQSNVDANNLSFTKTNYIDTLYTEEDHVMLEDIIWAIQHHRQIKFESHDWDKQILPFGFEPGMMLMPLKLIFHFGMLYISMYSTDAERIIIIPFHHVFELSISNITFNPAPYLPLLSDFLDTTFGLLPAYDEKVYDIEIEFAGYTGVFIQTMHWQNSQQFEKLDNGNILMKLKCRLNRELVGFVFYFLQNARVIKPIKLKKLVVEKLSSIMELYNQDEMVYKTSYNE